MNKLIQKSWSGFRDLMWRSVLTLRGGFRRASVHPLRGGFRGSLVWGFFVFAFVFVITPARAQDDSNLRQVYVQAESDFQIGRIEQARDALLENLSSFHGNLRQNALRLIALSYLARFDIQQTEQYTSLLLEQNPYYSPSSNDPAEFADIVNNIKAGMTATITTASSQAESLAEVPVPTTLITAEMIQNSGARNLQEVLAAYVPGMNLIDCNDDINVAMRGIYSVGQEKILIMLNGHRLNDYATNSAAPDFTMSLEKIKQIEVLRGPASSLYGGVALTAVVNIITKLGGDVDGLQFKAATGNHGQIRADAVFGKRYFDVDLLVWGSVYRNKGEKYDVGGERITESAFGMPFDHVRLGRVGDHPNYEVGLQLGWRGFQFLLDSRFSQYVAPFTMTSLALSYNRENYRSYNGLKPSFSNYSRHAEVNYSHQVKNLYLKYAVTYDKMDITRYQALNDMPMPGLGQFVGIPVAVDSVISKLGGISRYVNGQEQNYGFQFKGGYAYTLSDDHKGNIGFGTEYSHFNVDDIRYQIGYGFQYTFPEDPLIRDTGRGSEDAVNLYLQLKHQWRSLILNAGLRYDFKSQYDESKIRELSPRVALILLRPKWNIKLSYSKSFVDAPYIYRKANIMTVLMTGGDVSEAITLSPERVHSFQLSFAGTNWVKGLNFEVNGFYNRATDLIMTYITTYQNAGKNRAGGLEVMASYRSPQTVSTGSATGTPRFTANWNFTWMHTFRSNIMSLGLPPILDDYYSTDIDANNNTPSVMSNLVFAWQATRQLKLHTHLLFEGRQTSYNADLVQLAHAANGLIDFRKYADAGMEEQAIAALQSAILAARRVIMEKKMPARAIVSLGAEYTLGPLTFGFNVHNLLGTRYYRSGMNTNLIPQQGRWFLGSVAVRW